MSSVEIVLCVVEDNGKVDDNFRYVVNNRTDRHEEQRVVTLVNSDNVRAIAPDKVLRNNPLQVMVNSSTAIQPGHHRFTVSPYKQTKIGTYNLVFVRPAVINGKPFLYSTPKSKVNVRFIGGQSEQILLGGSHIKNMDNATADIPGTVRSLWKMIPKRVLHTNADLYEVIGTCILLCSQQNFNKVVCATNNGVVPPLQRLTPIPFDPATFGLEPVAVNRAVVADESDQEEEFVFEEEEEHVEEEAKKEHVEEEAEEEDAEDDRRPASPYRPTRDVTLKEAKLAKVNAEIAFLQAKLSLLTLKRAALL